MAETRYLPEEMAGLFAGQFEEEDYLPYLKSGELYKSYEGIAGLLGLSTLRLSRKKEARDGR